MRRRQGWEDAEERTGRRRKGGTGTEGRGEGRRGRGREGISVHCELGEILLTCLIKPTQFL